jgi:hypothetical protein
MENISAKISAIDIMKILQQNCRSKVISSDICPEAIPLNKKAIFLYRLWPATFN